ncbi:FAD-dependent oxidoreductase [Nocardioides sp. AN3]
MKNGQISYWIARPGIDAPRFAPVDTDLDVDVAVVGGGLTGLWAAWSVAVKDPSLTVALFEAESIGYGASGRNGGWLSAKPVGLRPVLARQPQGWAGVQSADRILVRSLDEVVDLLGVEQIDARRGGWMQVARTASEMRRVEEYEAKSRSWGVAPENLRVLSAAETTARVAVSEARGAIYSPDCYRIDPVKALARLARLARDAGVAIYTGSRVTDLVDHGLVVNGHSVRVGRHTVVATEGYSSWEKGEKRRLLPMNSAMVVTEPLAGEDWAKIGWDGAECLSGSAHTFFYAQRTADDRIAIGGRGKPYRFGSATDKDGQVYQQTVEALDAALRELFPGISFELAHAWCGVIGVSRDWSPFVEVDEAAQVTHVGGYAGQGLTAAYVGGCLVADLITGRETELTRLPWVRKRPRRWEPEPLRWLGANALYKAYSWADHLESRSKSTSTAWPARVADRIAGR